MDMSSGSPKRFIIITDSTELHNAYALKDARWSKLSTEIRSNRVEWLVPEVVIQETVRHHNEAYEAAIKKTIPSLRKTERALGQLGISVGLNAAELVRISQTEHDYENKLRARIAGIGGRIAALPLIGHAELLSWDLSQRKPFGQSGKGYRDALIWATTLECARQVAAHEHLIFVSNNTRDFASKGLLHDDLREDLSRSVPAINLSYCENLTAAFVLIEKLLEEDNQSVTSSSEKERLSTGGRGSADETNADPQEKATSGYPPRYSPKADLDELLREVLLLECGELVASTLEHHTKDGDFSRPEWIPAQLENPTIYHVDPLTDLMTWKLIEKFRDGAQLIHMAAPFTVTVDGYMDKGDYYAAESNSDSAIYALQADFNDHYALVAVDGAGDIEFSVLVSPDKNEVNHVELTSLKTRIL
ncbi:PIN domain-containing protein [Pseudarthrobacter sp. NPDC058329]|uniref:PIN domain-containing protein n=1 Tax=Pseudarthrobacter sp. NPDC058329 TaxID=3346448 RepID=UPI0036DA8960